MIRQGSAEDFEAVAALTGGRPEYVRAHWALPSFDPTRHLWLADGAYGALYAPDVALVQGDAAHAAELLAAIDAQARAEGFEHLSAVIPEHDGPKWRAYEAAGFALTTEVLRMEVVHESPPSDREPPAGVRIRTYRHDDAEAVRLLLDEAYLGWDDTYVPLPHDDWLAWMTQNDSFDPACWFLAEQHGTLVGVCLCWKEGWIKDLAVAENGRGRGLGETLLRHAFAVLYARGVRRVGLKVDARNPTGAVRLYERLGMKTVERLRTYVKHL